MKSLILNYPYALESTQVWWNVFKVGWDKVFLQRYTRQQNFVMAHVINCLYSNQICIVEYESLLSLYVPPGLCNTTWYVSKITACPLHKPVHSGFWQTILKSCHDRILSTKSTGKAHIKKGIPTWLSKLGKP